MISATHAATDKHFIDWEQCVFGFGYGSGEPHVIGALVAFMRSLDDGSYSSKKLESELGPVAAWLLINAMAHADIIEYGTSPRNGWITEKGSVLHGYLAGKSTDEVCAVLSSTDQDYNYCEPSCCSCTDKQCENPLFGENHKDREWSSGKDGR